jgi:hypothetical protein
MGPASKPEDNPMPLLTVEGIYRDGKVELTERPSHVDESTRVLVTFLPSDGAGEPLRKDQTEDRETLRQQAFAQMRQGIHLGGRPYASREELHDRFDR